MVDWRVVVPQLHSKPAKLIAAGGESLLAEKLEAWWEDGQFEPEFQEVKAHAPAMKVPMIAMEHALLQGATSKEEGI